MKKVLCFALALAMLISSVPAFAAEQKVVTVNNMQDMVSAIASNTKIIIEAGNYIAPAGWEGNEYGYHTGIRIKDVENLTFEAKGNVEIKLNLGYVPVFEIEDSKNITFIGLSLGHDVPEGGCEGDGDVIFALNSKNITIDNCDLWGCGIVGIVANYSENINVTNTTIRDCAVAAVRCDYMKGNVVLDTCQILRNTYYAKEEPMEWTACFTWRQSSGDTDAGKFIIKNSIIEGNYSANLYDDKYSDKLESSNKIEFVNCTFKNNAWDKVENEAPAEEPEQEYIEPEYEEPAPELPPEEYYDEPEKYDESIISVSGITGYDETRQVLYDNIVALCTAPVVITAKKDLMNMAVSKVEKIGGKWVETRYFDSYAINLGDTTKNWYPAQGFENVDEDYYEYTGTEEFFEGFEPVKKGKSVSFKDQGMYYMWAETEAGEYTGLTFEIKDATAAYTDSKVLVDGKQIKFEAYNINDNNYFKLRDIAFALTNHGTGLNVFNVKWDEAKNMINLVSGEKYTAVGGELKEGDGKNKKYEISTSALMKDGRNATLTAFLINGNNYFKLRDLGKLFDFNVSWDEANNCILIDSTASYRE
ncbi:MAG: hypothetical protein IJE46_02520 [Clostridia bacterium]|nr:hypothetical protein [Clostridia bacterium]